VLVAVDTPLRKLSFAVMPSSIVGAEVVKSGHFAVMARCVAAPLDRTDELGWIGLKRCRN
jgi:hypothetical protein